MVVTLDSLRSESPHENCDTVGGVSQACNEAFHRLWRPVDARPAFDGGEQIASLSGF
jgi:hypothetical protein